MSIAAITLITDEVARLTADKADKEADLAVLQGEIAIQQAAAQVLIDGIALDDTTITALNEDISKLNAT